MNDVAPRRPSRREFVGLLGGGAAGLLGLKLAASACSGARPGDATPATGGVRPRPLDRRAIAAGAAATRVLVVVELGGGNDGLSTTVPYGDPAYRRLRQTTALDAGELIPIDAMFGFHPGLAMCASRLAVVHGIGATDANGSHFDMSARWWAGDASGTRALATGFLGRLCDVLDDGAPVTGVSLAGATPAMLSDKAVTVGLPGTGEMERLLADDPWSRNFRRGYGELGTRAHDDRPAVSVARAGLERALRFGSLLDVLDDPGPDGDRVAYPGSPLGEDLRLAAALIGAAAGVRVVHVHAGGFDTHADQRGTHDRLMRELSEALAAFASDLDRRDLTESVLVATTSEFGRRPKENGNGTDHGAASCALLMGPVHPGLHGEAPSLVDLDRDDNLRATATLEQYYATLAEQWFGIDATAVLPGRPEPVPGVLNV